MMVKAVIFDVDGTLVDSVDLHAKAWQEAFAANGRTIAFADIRGQIGKGGDQLLPVFLSEDEIRTDGARIDAHRADLVKRRYLAQIRPFEQVRALFERLRQDGIRIALASSAKEDELQHHKKLLHIEDLLETQTSSDDAEKSKPSPDIFQAALARLKGIDATDAIVVGDTPYDAQAAAGAGLRCIGVLSGGFSEDSLRQAGCIAIYRDPADLLASYDGSPLAPVSSPGGTASTTAR